MKWVTRRSVHIDRAACAWVIRRLIDPDAEFLFVADVSDLPPEATPFDMPGVEYSHHGPDCTFETLLRRFDVADPVMWRIAALVHEADLDDGRFDAPEAPEFDLALRALSMVEDDDRVLDFTRPLFDGVFEFFGRELLLGREPA